MAIVRLTENNSDEVISIITSYNKYSNLPKTAIMSSIFYSAEESAKMSLYDKTVLPTIPRSMADTNNYWFGYYNSDNILAAFVRFRFWLDPNTLKRVWTLSAIHKNKTVDHTYSYNQLLFPDAVIHVINHGIELAESYNMVTGYYVHLNAVNLSHPNAHLLFYDLIDHPEFKLNKDRYTNQVVESIRGGDTSSLEKFRMNVSGFTTSVRRSIIELTKI